MLTESMTGSRHSEQEISYARQMYVRSADGVDDGVYDSRIIQKAMSPSGAWMELEKYYMPKTLAARHRVWRL